MQIAGDGLALDAGVARFAHEQIVADDGGVKCGQFFRREAVSAKAGDVAAGKVVDALAATTDRLADAPNDLENEKWKIKNGANELADAPSAPAV